VPEAGKATRGHRFENKIIVTTATIRDNIICSGELSIPSIELKSL
jgi:hypothetical protein